MSVEADSVMMKELHPWARAGLEFGPIALYLAIYLIYRGDTFLIGGTEYSGFVAITAAFIPIFVLSSAALWALTGRLTKIQLVTTGMLVLFGGLGAVMNDPAIFMVKPTAIYLLLGLILGAGLLRGQSWLKLVAEDMIPLKKKGWMILTKRLTLLFFLSAFANELVWRTQSEAFWVLFETLAMPVVVLVFFLSQIPLFAEYATFRAFKRKA